MDLNSLVVSKQSVRESGKDGTMWGHKTNYQKQVMSAPPIFLLLTYLIYKYKKTCNLGKLQFLSKIHKRLYRGTPTGKVCEILDYNLKPVMQNALFCIRDSGHFLVKIEGVGEIPENTLLVKSDVVGLYPSILHEPGLNALQEALNK